MGMNSQISIPLLPGGVGLTHLRVYDTLAPDGLPGRQPRMRISPAPSVITCRRGRGRVQTLSADEGFREFDLEPGGVVWFSPGVIHRLVNTDGRLEIFVVMQNGGLPESGDFVLTFSATVLADPAQYYATASLSIRGEVFTDSHAAAMHRRDQAVAGFAQLRQDVDRLGPDALKAFYAAALPARAAQARRLAGGLAEPARGPPPTRPAISSPRSGRGDVSHLLQGQARAMPPPSPDDRKLGMCGTLGT